MTTPVVLPAIAFDPPQLAPSRIGLYTAVDWLQDGDPFRAFLHEGIVIRPQNFGGEDAFGVWGAGWCADPNDIEPEDYKQGDRPDADDLTPFTPQTVFAFDRNQCGDLTAESQQEVRDRAQRTLERLEQIAAERQLAARLLDDVGTPDTADDILGAVAGLEAAFAATNTTGFIHLSPIWAASLQQTRLLIDAGGVFRSPLGNVYVFGGGYVGGTGLDDTLVATSQVYGWRGEQAFNEAIDPFNNRFIAVAERTVLLGYEKLVNAVEVTG